MTPLRDIFPHCLSAADIAGPGPSPWVTCSRPSCRLVYRSTAFTRVVTPPCPACGQPFLPGPSHPLTSAQREAMA